VRDTMNKENHLQKMAKEIFWMIITVITMFGYVSDVRPIINSIGTYFVGVSDGFFSAIVFIMIWSYFSSKKCN